MKTNKERVLEHIAKHPNSSARDVMSSTKISKTVVAVCLHDLCSEGKIALGEGRRCASRWKATPKKIKFPDWLEKVPSQNLGVRP